MNDTRRIVCLFCGLPHVGFLTRNYCTATWMDARDVFRLLAMTEQANTIAYLRQDETLVSLSHWCRGLNIL